MGELGSGDGSSYPGALDTDSSREVNDVNPGKTKARAEVVNDLASAIVAIENELGVNPAGTKTTVVKRFDTEHGLDGTHSAGINLSTAGLQGSASTTPVSNQITVTASGTLVIDENIEMLGRVASGDVPLIRLTKNLNGPVFDSTDTMISGTVPLARMQRTEVSSQNANNVTILPTVTTITTVSLGTVMIGDRILVSAAVFVTKGGTAGDITIAIGKVPGDTAIIRFYHTDSRILNRYYEVPANKGFYFSIFGIAKVTATGTLKLKMDADSQGSDSIVMWGRGQIHAIVLNNG